MIGGEMKTKLSIAIVAAAVVLAGAGILKTSRINAQARPTNLLVTWHAETYTPSMYPGKALPVANSKVILTADLIDSGKVVDLSPYVVLWYLNNHLLDGGLGISHTNLAVNPDASGSTLQIRAEVPDYKGGVIEAVLIPIAFPLVAIETPSQDRRLQSRAFVAKARPYFFNVTSASQLNFAWTLNGEVPQSHENPDVLNISVSNQDAAGGNTVTVGLTVSNPAAGLNSERVSQSVPLTFAP